MAWIHLAIYLHHECDMKKNKNFRKKSSYVGDMTLALLIFVSSSISAAAESSSSLQVQITPSAIAHLGNKITDFAGQVGIAIESNTFNSFSFNTSDPGQVPPDIQLVLDQVFKVLAHGLLNVVSKNQMNVALDAETIQYATNVKSLSIQLDPQNSGSANSARFNIALTLNKLTASVQRVRAHLAIAGSANSGSENVHAKIKNIQLEIPQAIELNINAGLEVINGKWKVTVNKLAHNFNKLPIQIGLGDAVAIEYKVSGGQAGQLMKSIVDWATADLPTQVAQRLNQLNFDLTKQQLSVDSPLLTEKTKRQIEKNPLQVLVGIDFANMFQVKDQLGNHRLCINGHATIQERSLKSLSGQQKAAPSGALLRSCLIPTESAGGQPVPRSYENADIVARLHGSLIEKAVAILFTKGYLNEFVLYDGTIIKLVQSPTLIQGIKFSPERATDGTLHFSAVMGAALQAEKAIPTKNDISCSVRNALRSSTEGTSNNSKGKEFGVDYCTNYANAKPGNFVKPVFLLAEKIAFNGPVGLNVGIKGQVALDKDKNIVVILKGVDEENIEVNLDRLIVPLKSFEFTKSIVKRVIKWQIETIAKDFSTRSVELADGTITQGVVLVDKLPLPDVLLEAPGDIQGFSASPDGFMNVFINLDKNPGQPVLANP